MIKKLICAAALLMVAGLQHTRAQYVYGTTGLLHAPSADMQRDKTFLCGFSYLQVAATPKHWNYDTWNYYINITLFPWLEVGYTCTLHKIGLPQYGYSYKFRNQDRQFSARLRVWIHEVHHADIVLLDIRNNVCFRKFGSRFLKSSHQLVGTHR